VPQGNDPYNKVLPGWPQQIPARVWNQLIDVALGQHFKAGGILRQVTRQADVIKVRNDSDTDLYERFGVLGIDQPLILPDQSENHFQQQVQFSGVTPRAGVHEGRFVIMVDPVAKGNIASGIVSGLAPVKLSVPDPDNIASYAEIADGSLAVLASQKSGSAFVCWVEDNGQSIQWAIVRVGQPDKADIVRVDSEVLTGGFYPATLEAFGIPILVTETAGNNLTKRRYGAVWNGWVDGLRLYEVTCCGGEEESSSSGSSGACPWIAVPDPSTFAGAIDPDTCEVIISFNTKYIRWDGRCVVESKTPS
jgi:hypothetical protein